MKPYPCIESTLDIDHYGLTIRLWINEDEIEEEYPHHIEIKEKILDFIKKNINGIDEGKKFIEYCKTEIPNLNAVQVKSKAGHGVVVYLVDFSSDVHG